MIRRERLTWTRRTDVEETVAALRESATRRKGMYARELPVPAGRRPAMMRYLRESGIPIVAVRRGVESVWFILTFHPREAQKELAEQWNQRNLEDHYAATCRTHMALVPGRHTKRLARLIASHAVLVGAELGFTVEEVLGDITPTVVPEFIEELMNEVH